MKSTLNQKPDWPPPYQVRRSTRVKRVQLQFAAHKGLEVVIPENRKTAVNVEHLLNVHRAWIESHLSKIITYTFPPKYLNLDAIHSRFYFSYFPTHAQTIHWVEKGAQIELEGKISDEMALKKALKQWLTEKAKETLLPWFKKVCEEVNTFPKVMSINQHKTSWGVCKAKQIIYLNAKLLFLPEVLVRHVMLHELCHLEIMDHSLDFKRKLAEWDPESRRHAKMLNSATHYVPSWLY